MKPDVVVDVGNTRMKWGLCQDDAITQVCSLPYHDFLTWKQQVEQWQLSQCSTWVIAGVVPNKREIFAEWLNDQGHQVKLLTQHQDLPIRIALERPERVGIDRLLDAVAANNLRPKGVPSIQVDIGSAATVDLVDADGCFQGGAILPGLRLMIQSLHDYTALLPKIDIPHHSPAVPGLSTTHAMELGVFWAVVGGIQALIEAYCKKLAIQPIVFVTGGDAAIVASELAGVVLIPHLTLEGIRVSAGGLP